ncbi:MAG: zinc-ribbon domain-containing protein, partial [Firmicutes bacterium]|nr:zinc-ribbon domain-containing protein [Bacillota bacterium]
MKCSNCGAENRAKDKFCVKCGTRLPEQTNVAAYEVVTVNADGSNINALIERAFLFLEDGEFARADHYFEQILNNDPKNAKAYLGKLMAELQVKTESALADEQIPFDDSANYEKACRFDAEQKNRLEEINRGIVERNEHNRMEKIYGYGATILEAATSEEDYRKAAEVFQSIPQYRDAEALAKECEEKAVEAKNDSIYQQAVANAESGESAKVEVAIKQFELIPDWKDSKEQIEACKVRVEELKAEEERLAEEQRIAEEKAKAEAEEQANRLAEEKAAKAKKTKKKLILIGSLILAAIVAVVVATPFVLPGLKYNKAESYEENGELELAALTFSSIPDYEDAKERSL